MRPGAASLFLILALALSACSKPSDETLPAVDAAAIPEPAAPDERVGRGEAIAEVACASCHAIGATGESPHAEAPAFRVLHKTVDLQTLRTRFVDGTVSDHPEMPDWDFDPIDLDAVVVYLETVQAPGPVQ